MSKLEFSIVTVELLHLVMDAPGERQTSDYQSRYELEGPLKSLIPEVRNVAPSLPLRLW